MGNEMSASLMKLKQHMF